MYPYPPECSSSPYTYTRIQFQAFIVDMSPYIDLCERDETSRSNILLQEHDISDNGFLPQEAPLSRLPDLMYTPWENILSQLPELLKSRDLRHSIGELDVLSTKGLRTHEEWRRAYVVLSFLAHGYIWGGDKASEVRLSLLAADMVRLLNTDTQILTYSRPSHQQSRYHTSKSQSISVSHRSRPTRH